MERSRMGKKIKWGFLLLITFTLFFSVISIKLQIEYERYIKFHKEEYGVLKDRKRLLHTPVILYLFELKILKNKYLDTDAYNIIKYKPGIYDISITMQKYMINCYFSEKEKIEFVDNLKKSNNMVE